MFTGFPPAIEPEETNLLDIGRSVGSALVEAGKDIANLPVRSLDSLEALFEGGKVALGLALEGVGLERLGQSEAFQPDISPGEAQERLTASALDAALAAIPIGKLVPKSATGLLAKIGRAAATGGKFAALTPERAKAGSIKERGRALVEGAFLTAMFPPLGVLVAPIGRAGQRVISKGLQALSQKLGPKGEFKVLRATSRTLQRAYIRAFFGQTPEHTIQETLPKLFQPLGRALRDTLTQAGQIIEPQLEKILRTGTLSAAKEEAGKAVSGIAKELFPDTGSILISANRLRGIKVALVAAGAALEAAGKRLEGSALKNPALVKQFQGFRAFYDALVGQFIQQRRATGQALRTFQEPINRDFVEVVAAQLDKVGISVEALESRLATINETAFRQVLRQVQNREGQKAAQTAIARLWRPLLFPITSFVADTYTNVLRTGQAVGEAGIDDVFDFVRKGVGPVRTEAFLRAIRHSATAKAPSVLSPSALSEQFSNVFGPRLDKLLLTGAVLKRTVDTQFAKIGFFSRLYEEGLRRAEKLGLKGVERTSFVRRTVLEAEEKAPEAFRQAIERANTLRFFGPLSKTEEAIASSTALQLLVNPFFRFTFQFTRWMAEFTPASPTFLKKLAANQATAADFTKFVTRNLTGIGAVYYTDQTLYDNVDFDTFEYVDPDSGARRSLSGFSPLPELLATVALFRGDAQKAFQAFGRGGLSFFGLRGILGRFFEAASSISRGADPRILIEELENVAASAFPGKSVLAGLGALVNPVQRTGLGRVIPGLGRPRIDPLTGEERKIERTIALGTPLEAVSTGIPASPAFGSRLTERRISEIETLFRELDVTIRTPPPTSLTNPSTRRPFERARDVSPGIKDEWQREVGRQRNLLFSNIDIGLLRRLPKEIQKARLAFIKRNASARARQILNRKLLTGALE